MLVRAAPESQEKLGFNVSHGSHRNAVRHNATLFPCPPREKYQIKKFVSIVPWFVFLVSAVSEYGFDLDFPLTPPVWLVIAVCAVVMATAHVAIGSRIHGIGKREIGTHLSGDVPSLSGSASSVSAGNKSPRIRDRSPSICQDNFDGSDGCHDLMRASGVVVTGSDAIPAVIFLSPAVTRGPPWSESQVDRTPGRSAQQFSVAPIPSETHLHDSSAARTAFLNDPDFSLHGSLFCWESSAAPRLFPQPAR